MGRVIRQLMRQKKMSISELAKLTGLGRNKISEIMNGQVEAKPDEIERIASALGVPVEELKYRQDKYRI